MKNIDKGLSYLCTKFQLKIRICSWDIYAKLRWGNSVLFFLFRNLCSLSALCFSCWFCSVDQHLKYIYHHLLYKAKYLHDAWTVGGPKDYLYGRSVSDQMMNYNFEQWFIKGFVKYVKSYEKPLLCMDGYGSFVIWHMKRWLITLY